MARIAPGWMATLNKAHLSASKPSNSVARMRCPVDETGKYSVSATAYYVGKIKVGKLDCDQSRKVAGQYDIRSIPTVLVFKGGQIDNRFVYSIFPP